MRNYKETVTKRAYYFPTENVDVLEYKTDIFYYFADHTTKFLFTFPSSGGLSSPMHFSES